MATGAAGCDRAFHAAAALGEWGRREDFERGNVAGTRNALAASARAGVKRRFVHVGTEAALLAGEPLVNVDETAPLRPDSKALYSATKAQAEQAVLDANRDGELETVVVRPRLVWGAGDTTILPGIVEAVRSKRFRWIGGGRHRTSTTHVDNVVEGLVLGAERGRPGGAYFVTDGEPGRLPRLRHRAAGHAGRRDPRQERAAGSRARGRGRDGGDLGCAADLRRPPVTRLAYWLAALETTIDISRAREELGYAPVRTIAEGMAGAARRARRRAGRRVSGCAAGVS